MKFYTIKKKSVNVPILSLLDILAILLIYTVVSSEFIEENEDATVSNAAGFQLQERAALKVETPSTKSLNTKTLVDERVQIVLAANGQISFAGSLIDKQLLVSYLRAMNGKKLEIKADKKVTLDQWVFMLESLKEAGISAAEVPWLINDKSKPN